MLDDKRIVFVVKNDITNILQYFFIALFVIFFFSACTDYVAQIEEKIENFAVIGEFEDLRDNQTYKTVKIGEQVWMAQNLNYKMDSSFCYNNVDSNCSKYGRLYTWVVAIGKSDSECGYGKTCSLSLGYIQGACPTGWHLPSKYEWNVLITAVGGASAHGRDLKSSFDWSSNGNGSDLFGFSALPAGYRNEEKKFDHAGEWACFWSSSESNSLGAEYMYLYYNSYGAFMNGWNKNNACSVRCVKD